MKYALKSTLIGLIPFAIVGALFLSGLLILAIFVAAILMAAFAIGSTILESRDDAKEDGYDWP